jgi:enoyl-CoA hydratase/carnithine racemase
VENEAASPLVLVERPSDGVALLRFNRPEKRNAMSRQARRELLTALDELKGDARVIVITGNGPAFCAGVDLTEASEDPRRNGADGEYPWIAVQEAIKAHPAIIIAAVNGFALGGGVTLINSSDLALAATTAQIGMPEIGFGLYPGLAGPSTQMRILRKHAAWMVLTGRRISGSDAAAWGLVNVAVELDELLPEALELAAHVAAFDATTLEWCKRALWEVPMHISDWSSALAFGEGIGDQIKLRSDVVANGLQRFAKGERNPGQGAHASR